MNDKELEGLLKQHYSIVKDQDKKLVPVFEEVISVTKRDDRPRFLIPTYLKIAASLILISGLVALGYFLSLSDENQEMAIEPNITDNLLVDHTYIWEWSSPTDQLLDIEINLKKNIQKNN